MVCYRGGRQGEQGCRTYQVLFSRIARSQHTIPLAARSSPAARHAMAPLVPYRYLSLACGKVSERTTCGIHRLDGNYHGGDARHAQRKKQWRMGIWMSPRSSAGGQFAVTRFSGRRALPAGCIFFLRLLVAGVGGDLPQPPSNTPDNRFSLLILGEPPVWRVPLDNTTCPHGGSSMTGQWHGQEAWQLTLCPSCLSLSLCVEDSLAGR